MKFLVLSTLIALFCAFASAAITLKPVVITYPDNTPSHVIQAAKDAIVEAGGRITHEYNMIKGFAANAPDKVVQSVSAMSAEYNAIIEQDGVVSTLNNIGGN